MARLGIILLFSIMFLLKTEVLQAQSFSVSTNIADWANFGTVNLEAGMSVSRHFSIVAGGHYNPWEFQSSKGYDMHNRQTTGYAGARYWPWYVFSGWWVGAKLQYSSFSRTGIWRPALEQGRSLGAGLSLGYTIMLHKNLNIELGAGLWGGRHLEYTLYECPECMRIRENGPRGFISPDEVSLSIMYIF